MKKWILTVCLLTAFLLTGCGEKEGVWQYADLDNIKMLDTAQELEAADKELVKEDQGKWSYRLEKIQEVIDLFDKIEKNCENEKVDVGVENIEGDEGANVSARIWAEHAQSGKDPRKETLKGLNLYMSIKDKEAVIATCNKLAELGLSSFRDYSGNISTVENGYVIDLTFDEEDYDDYEYWPYRISIRVPDVMVYGPERYFDIMDACMNDGWIIENLICRGGAIDGLVLSNEYESEDDINVDVLMKDGKILEISAFRVEWEKGDFFTEEEQKGMAELVARMCGDRNGAVSLLKGLTSGGKRKGTIGDYTWTIKRGGFFDSYVFRIQ